MVVVPEPAVKRGGSFRAVAVDRAVCPAGEHGADEPFGFAIGLRPVVAGAQVPDPERPARDCVDRGAVGGSVVCHEPLDGDAVAGVERNGSVEEPDNGGGLLVAENLGIGKPGAVVDRDMHAFVTGGVAPDSGSISSDWVAARPTDPISGAFARTTADASEFLDVDVDQLAWSSSLVALRGLESQATQPAHPRSGQDPRN